MIEWKKIEDFGPYFGGLTGKTKDDFVDGNAKFITYMNVYTNPSLDISTTGVVKITPGEKQNKIQKGDILFTGSSETPEEAGMSCVVTEDFEEDVYMNSFCFGIRLTHPEQYDLGYLKHILRSNKVRKEISKSASGVTRFNISKSRFGKVLIPIPSLSEQTRIVDILDTFTASIDNLKEQISERRKQYEYYRDQILDFEGKEGVELKIEEFCLLKAGKSIKSDVILEHSVENDYPCYGGNGIRGYVPFYSHDGEFPIIGRQGALCGCVNWATGKFYATEHAVVAKGNNQVIQRFLLHLFQHADLNQYKTQGAQSGLSVAKLNEISFFIPSLSEQSRIVSILDTFEASIANLEAQLELREKQYEYYRNKLLTFE
jgi:type I restriction enzyme S subunit